MRRAPLLGIAALLALAGCAAAPAVEGPREVPLANAGFEQAPVSPDCPPGWFCAARATPYSFRFFLDGSSPAEGVRSLCIEPVGHEPWAYATQSIPDRGLGGHRVRFSMSVRVDGVTGRGGGIVARAHDGHGRTIAYAERLVTGTAGWKSLFLELDVPPGANDVEVGGLLDGRGRVCVDEARLAVVR